MDSQSGYNESKEIWSFEALMLLKTSMLNAELNAPHLEFRSDHKHGHLTLSDYGFNYGQKPSTVNLGQ